MNENLRKDKIFSFKLTEKMKSDVTKESYKISRSIGEIYTPADFIRDAIHDKLNIKKRVYREDKTERKSDDLRSENEGE